MGGRHDIDAGTARGRVLDPAGHDLGETDSTTGSADPAAEGEEFDGRIVRSFFRGGRLVTIPAKKKKREAVLRFLLDECFADNGEYTEREVNERLRTYHDDVAALRRYMVAAGMMTRNAGIYRRVRSAEPGDKDG